MGGLLLTLWLLLGSPLLCSSAPQEKGEEHEVLLTGYSSHSAMLQFLRYLEVQAPAMASTYVLGQSVEGRDIMGLRLSAGGGGERPLLRPMVKYVGNMHGNEVVGREVLLALAEYLVYNYGQVERVTRLLNTTEVHLVPTMNPDGYSRVAQGKGWRPSRHNANDVDLNRAFPTWREAGQSREELLAGRQPEVAAVLPWILDSPWLLSANMHGGAVVANYPWDPAFSKPWTTSQRFREHKEGSSWQFTADNPEFVSLASLYASRHSTMSQNTQRCVNDVKFEDGITNGLEWYSAEGTMQDFNYVFTNCLEITLELSCNKKPPPGRLQKLWEANKEPLMAYLEEAQQAVKGLVLDEAGGPVAGAVVVVKGRDKDLVTSTRGEWWRLLVPGSYTVWAHSGGRRSREVTVTVKERLVQADGGEDLQRHVVGRVRQGAEDHGHGEHQGRGMEHHVDLQLSEPYTPSPRPLYPAPAPLPSELETLFSSSPLLEAVWALLDQLPFPPDLLLQELVAPSLQNFSLTSSPLQVGGMWQQAGDIWEQSDSLTIQELVQGWASWLQWQSISNQEQGLGADDYPGLGLLWVDLGAGSPINQTGLARELALQLAGLGLQQGLLVWLEEGLATVRAVLTEEGLEGWLDSEQARGWNSSLQGAYSVYLHFYRLYTSDFTEQEVFGGSMDYQDYYEYMMDRNPENYEEWYYYADYARDYYGSTDSYDYYDYHDFFYDYSSNSTEEGSELKAEYYDDYYYYSDQWVNYPEVTSYLHRLTRALEALEEAGGARALATRLARMALAVWSSAPMELVLARVGDILEMSWEKIQGAEEEQLEGIVDTLARLYWDLQVGEWSSLLDRVMGDRMWEELDSSLSSLHTSLFSFLQLVAREQGLLSQGCGSLEQTPHPWGCTVSHNLWEGLYIMEEMAMGNRKEGLRRARKMATAMVSHFQVLKFWLEDLGPSDYCSLTSSWLGLEEDLLEVSLGLEGRGQEGRQLLQAYRSMGKLVLEGCPDPTATS